MTEPHGNGPMGPDDELAALAGLDLALDELAAGRDLPAEGAGGEAAALATLAAELRAAAPAPPPGAAERGRAAFLATAAGGGRRPGATWRRSLPLRIAAVAAALVALVALPAAARQAEPGTALWPVRQVGQQVRDRLADDPVHRANLRLNTAEDYIEAGAGAGEERREDMADAAEEKIEDALEALKDRSGPQVAAVRARAIALEARVEALERQKDGDDRSGSGGDTEPGDDNSGPGGGDDRSGGGDDDPSDDDNRVPAVATTTGGRAPGRARAPRAPGRGRGRANPGPAMTERTGAVDGRRLGGRYRMGALLAVGGMGEVWAARDLLLDRAVAVKVLGRALAGDGRAAERLRREARAAGRLEHPNIARVLDLGEHDGRPYLVMELLEGESLAARIDRAGPMPAAEAARVVAAVADALEAAHRAGVVHRDVKPGNVFLTSAGEVKVLDFGIASAAGDAALTTGDLIGTAAYLAPERVLGHRATPAADIYALGVVLYELLAGHRPFEAGSEVELAMAHVNATPPPLGRAAPSAPPSLVAACSHALAKDPSSRPSSAAAFAQLVRDPGIPSPATLPLPVGGAGRPAARRFEAAWAGGGAAAGRCLAGRAPGLLRRAPGGGPGAGRGPARDPRPWRRRPRRRRSRGRSRRHRRDARPGRPARRRAGRPGGRRPRGRRRPGVRPRRRRPRPGRRLERLGAVRRRLGRWWVERSWLRPRRDLENLR